MLRPTLVRCSRTFIPCTRRHFSSTFFVRNPALAKAGPDSPHKPVGKGQEGLHRQDVSSKKGGGDALTHPDRISTLPENAKSAITGDWVLFHPVYSKEEVKAVEVLHRDAKTFGDKVAASFVTVLRRGFDLVSMYKHKPLPPNHQQMSLQELRKGGYILDENQWLIRILFLESIAGVPGMVAATCRHLRSMRLMRRDSGWIHTLLEEAENERMHLMTFMTLKKPSLFFRGVILGAQGVFYNLFFLAYLISPKMCHRFVAYLEEEAVLTYTRTINELEIGHLPQWENVPAPEIAKDYWRLPADATLLDVLYAVRSDETTHRFVNHSLANLNVDSDVNPFALKEPDMFVKGVTPGFTREQSESYVKELHELVAKSEAISKKP